MQTVPQGRRQVVPGRGGEGDLAILRGVARRRETYPVGRNN